MSQQRIQREKQKLIQAGYTVQGHQQEAYDRVLTVGIRGPKDSPYKDGWFYILIKLKNFPWGKPCFYFRTPVYHPLLQLKEGFQIPCCLFGSTCSCLQSIGVADHDWVPTFTLKMSIEAIMRFLYDPANNPSRWRKHLGMSNLSEYKTQAKQWTTKFATQNNHLHFKQNLQLAKQLHNCPYKILKDNQKCAMCQQNLFIEDYKLSKCEHKYHEKCFKKITSGCCVICSVKIE